MVQKTQILIAWLCWLLLTLASSLAMANSSSQAIKKTIRFPSQDGLIITADTYIDHKLNAPFIVLFHQARWSRGEYLETALRLNKLGFNCMAVDQRSGGQVNDVENQTFGRAKAQDKKTTYIDAYADMEAALHYAHSHFAKGKLIIWGSSYSAALVFRLAAENKDIVSALLAFSPGEYFEKLTGKKDYITQFAKQVNCPVYITSAQKEKPLWQGIYKALATQDKTSFLPTTAGNHGSKALWKQFKDNGGYWKTVTEFLLRFVG